MNIEASEIREAVEIIKTAILQGQYEASKDVNRIQLTIYFSIGKYISNHTRKGGWGTNILESISEHLHKELPGLRGYSATNLRNMRLFYESWQMLDSNSSVMTDENSKRCLQPSDKYSFQFPTDHTQYCHDAESCYDV